MLTAAGSGYSTWRDLAVTRWREDATCDDWGSYVYLRDTASNEVWSAAYQPIGAEPETYRVTFNEKPHWRSWFPPKTIRKFAA
jgi:cyclic beta-1,2-glucan synthetase